MKNGDDSDDGAIVIDRKQIGLDQISQPKATLLFT